MWRLEGDTWLLVREGPPAEDFADELLAAEPGARAGLLADRPDELTASLTYVLSQRASRLAVMENYQGARTLFELTLAVARSRHDRRAVSEALQNVANACYFLKDYDTATRVYQERLGLAREAKDDEATAASILGLATVAYARGDYSAALVSYRDALAIYEARDEAPSIGRTLVSVGNVQYLQADYDVSAATYRRALALLDGVDPPGAALARSGVARVLAAQGDAAGALDTYGQVLADARQRAAADPRVRGEVAAALEAIGDLHLKLGNTDPARAAYDEARHLSDADVNAAGRLLGSLGLTELFAARFDAALADYTESRTRYERANAEDGVARAWVGIGFSQTARENFAEAEAAYRTAIGIFEPRQLTEAAARSRLGLSLAQSGAGELDDALATARAVSEAAERLDNDDLRWQGAARTGDALRRLGRFDAAGQAFTAAIAIIDRIAADAPVSADARGRLGDSASAWAGLALTLAQQGDAAGALAALEARRAHIRRVHLAGFQRDISRGETADEQAEEQGIVRDLISTRAQLRAETTAPAPDPARLARLRDELAALAGRRADQQARLYARLPELRRWRGLAPAPVDAASVNALVPGPSGLLVAYLVTDDELLIVTAGHGDRAADISAVVVPSKRRDIAVALTAAMQAPSLKDEALWRERAAPLAAALIDPIAPRLAGLYGLRLHSRRPAVEGTLRSAAQSRRRRGRGRRRHLRDLARHASGGAAGSRASDGRTDGGRRHRGAPDSRCGPRAADRDRAGVGAARRPRRARAVG